jgi:hypothetical protein
MSNELDKVLQKMRKDFLLACKENMKISKEISKKESELIKAVNEGNNLFIEAYHIELQDLCQRYFNNARKVGVSMFAIGLYNDNFSNN